MVNSVRNINLYNPQRLCLLCGCGLSNHKQQDYPVAELCGSCHEFLAYPAHSCFCCSIPMTYENLLCPDCQKQRPHFDQSLCILLYEGIGRHIIQKIKRGHDVKLIFLFCQLLFNRLKMADIIIDLLIYTPMHWKKNLVKGNSHSYIIAQTLSRITGIPLQKNTFTQRQVNQEQKYLNSHKRKVAILGRYQTNQCFNGLRVGIIDDVMTTGSTMNELSRIVKLQGAKKIYPIVLARTPKK